MKINFELQLTVMDKPADGHCGKSHRNINIPFKNRQQNLLRFTAFFFWGFNFVYGSFIFDTAAVSL